MSLRVCTPDPDSHKRQLVSGHPEASVNCGVATTMHAIQSGSCNHADPSYTVVRGDMRKPTGPTNPQDWKRAYDAWSASRLGRDWEMGLRGKLARGLPFTELRDWLDDDKGALVGIDYGTYNDSGAPSGDPRFRGYHGIYLKGIRRTKNGKLQVRSWDSLFDGRRRGIPRGPTWVSWAKLKAAMGDYARAAGYRRSSFYGVLARPGRKWISAPPQVEEGAEPEAPEMEVDEDDE